MQHAVQRPACRPVSSVVSCAAVLNLVPTKRTQRQRKSKYAPTAQFLERASVPKRSSAYKETKNRWIWISIQITYVMSIPVISIHSLVTHTKFISIIRQLAYASRIS